MRQFSGVILKKDNKILLVQEKQPSAYGQWALPAGEVEAGESYEETASREAYEETGFTVKIINKIKTYEYTEPEYQYHVFRAEIASGEITINPEEILDIQWYTPDEIQKLELRPSNKFIKELSYEI
jgi:8-oxo-dGTP diphosphatase